MLENLTQGNHQNAELENPDLGQLIELGSLKQSSHDFTLPGK